jgi:hypothetical protein
MIFDKKYRATLAKDGASRYLYAGKLMKTLRSLPLQNDAMKNTNVLRMHLAS